MSEQNAPIKGFWEDLKRRHVVRVAIGYAVVAWALVEVANVLLPTFDAPGWLFRAVVALAFLGLPITVILAWVFDISGGKVVVTDASGSRMPTWIKGVLALPLIGLVALSGWWVWSGYVAEKETSVRPTDLAGKVPVVAVTQIRNLTGDDELDWFSEGLANLVRDNLTRSKHLRVVSPVKWESVTAGATTEGEMAQRAADEGIGFIVGGEMLATPAGISITSRLTDTEGGVALSARQIQNLSQETLLSAATPIAAQVRQGLNVPREEQVDVFAADFATNNLAAYESYIAGLGFFLKFQYEKAAQSFKAALELAPDFAVARYRLAYIQAVTGDTELAIENAERALASEHLADRERRYIEAALAWFKRDYASAAEQYEALLEKYPFEVEARELLAKNYWGLRRYEDTIREFERLAREEPQNEVIWSSLGGYLLAMGEFERAQPALQRFLTLAPDNPNSYTLLGDSLRYQGKFEAAVEQYQKALAIDPHMREVAASLATIDYLQGDYVEAQEEFARIVDNEELILRERLDALFPLASLLTARGDFSEADAQLSRFADGLKKERTRMAMALSMRALQQLEMGQVAAARELASEALEASPGVPTRYLFARGIIELNTGQLDRVLATAEEITRHALPPEDPDRTEEKAAAFLSGMALLAQERLPEAREQLERAVSLEGHPYAIYELGLARAMLRMDETLPALELVREAVRPDLVEPRIDLEPDRVHSLLLRAEIHRAAGDLEAAAKWARSYLERFDRAAAAHPKRALAAKIAGAEGK